MRGTQLNNQYGRQIPLLQLEKTNSGVASTTATANQAAAAATITNQNQQQSDSVMMRQAQPSYDIIPSTLTTVMESGSIISNARQQQLFRPRGDQNQFNTYLSQESEEGLSFRNRLQSGEKESRNTGQTTERMFNYASTREYQQHNQNQEQQQQHPVQQQQHHHQQQHLHHQIHHTPRQDSIPVYTSIGSRAAWECLSDIRTSRDQLYSRVTTPHERISSPKGQIAFKEQATEMEDEAKTKRVRCGTDTLNPDDLLMNQQQFYQFQQVQKHLIPTVVEVPSFNYSFSAKPISPQQQSNTGSNPFFIPSSSTLTSPVVTASNQPPMMQIVSKKAKDAASVIARNRKKVRSLSQISRRNSAEGNTSGMMISGTGGGSNKGFNQGGIPERPQTSRASGVNSQQNSPGFITRKFSELIATSKCKFQISAAIAAGSDATIQQTGGIATPTAKEGLKSRNLSMLRSRSTSNMVKTPITSNTCRSTRNSNNNNSNRNTNSQIRFEVPLNYPAWRSPTWKEISPTFANNSERNTEQKQQHSSRLYNKGSTTTTTTVKVANFVESQQQTLRGNQTSKSIIRNVSVSCNPVDVIQEINCALKSILVEIGFSEGSDRIDMATLFALLATTGFIREKPSDEEEELRGNSAVGDDASSSIYAKEQKIVFLVWTLLGGGAENQKELIFRSNVVFFLTIVLGVEEGLSMGICSNQNKIGMGAAASNVIGTTKGSFQKSFSQIYSQRKLQSVLKPLKNLNTISVEHLKRNSELMKAYSENYLEISLGTFNEKGQWEISEEDKFVIKKAFELFANNREEFVNLRREQQLSSTNVLTPTQSQSSSSCRILPVEKRKSSLTKKKSKKELVGSIPIQKVFERAKMFLSEKENLISTGRSQLNIDTFDGQYSSRFSTRYDGGIYSKSIQRTIERMKNTRIEKENVQQFNGGEAVKAAAATSTTNEVVNGNVTVKPKKLPFSTRIDLSSLNSSCSHRGISHQNSQTSLSNISCGGRNSNYNNNNNGIEPLGSDRFQVSGSSPRMISTNLDSTRNWNGSSVANQATTLLHLNNQSELNSPRSNSISMAFPLTSPSTGRGGIESDRGLSSSSRRSQERANCDLLSGNMFSNQAIRQFSQKRLSNNVPTYSVPVPLCGSGVSGSIASTVPMQEITNKTNHAGSKAAIQRYEIDLNGFLSAQNFQYNESNRISNSNSSSSTTTTSGQNNSSCQQLGQNGSNRTILGINSGNHFNSKSNSSLLLADIPSPMFGYSSEQSHSNSGRQQFASFHGGESFRCKI